MDLHAHISQFRHEIDLMKIPREFFVEISRNRIANMTFMNKYGRNNDIDSATPEDIWAGGGTRVFLSAAETMDITSTSTNDTNSSGTGTRTLVIAGLDSNYDEISETVNMNGTTPVTTSNSYLRIFRVYSDTCGSVGTNDGDITIDPTTSGSGSRQAFIATGDGQTFVSHYTIPNNCTGYMCRLFVCVGSSAGASGTREALVRFWIRPENGSWRLQGEYTARNDGSGLSPDLSYCIPQPIAAKTDIKFNADADTNNTSVFVQYSLLLEEKTS